MTPGRLPNWESGPQNQPRANVAVSKFAEKWTSEADRRVTASESLGLTDIDTPPLKATRVTAETAIPVRKIRTTRKLIIYDTLPA